MKGSNSIDVNTATMLEAVQKWADEQFAESVKILSVASLDMQRGTFRITFESPDEASRKS